MTRSSTKVTLRAQLTCALPVSYTCNRPVDIIPADQILYQGVIESPLEIVHTQRHEMEIAVRRRYLGRYPLAYYVSAYNFHQTSSSSSRRPWARERKQRSIRSGREISSSLHRRCYGARTHKGYSCETTCDECDGLARRYNTQACHALPKGHSKRNSCDHVGVTTIPRGKSRLTATIDIDQGSSRALCLKIVS